jgi:hypothetical protein
MPTEPGLLLSERSVVFAAAAAAGLSCAVEDKSTERAAAWANAAMSEAVAIATASPKAAGQFIVVMEGLEKRARQNGGFNCDRIPKWPDR